MGNFQQRTVKLPEGKQEKMIDAAQMATKFPKTMVV